MDSLSLLGTAVALAMDAFAVATAVSVGLPRITARQTFRLSWHFGLFQAIMPILGWFGGTAVSGLFQVLDHWIAFGLLVLLGVRMIRESLHPEQRSFESDPTRGWSLVGLSVATSIDAFAVGLSLGLIGVSIWFPAAAIGVITLLLTFVGTRIGRLAGARLGKWAERVGGLVLIFIGTRILIQHLSGTGG